MTLQEFSDQFDVLYNNITSAQAPGLDEYEKSVFLTLAQNEILIAYFDPRRNKTLEGYDSSQKRQIDFSNVTVVYNTDEFGDPLFDLKPNSKCVEVPSDILMIINERVTVRRDGKSCSLTVLPLLFQEYSRLSSKPFSRPLKRLAWRLLNAEHAYNNVVYSDLIVGVNDTIENYSIRYILRMPPIILCNLEDGLTILNESKAIECKVDPILHLDILKRAVELAKAAYDGTLNSILTTAQLSQSEIGQVRSGDDNK